MSKKLKGGLLIPKGIVDGNYKLPRVSFVYSLKVCDCCGKEFDHEPLPVADENYNIQKGLVSCGCHIYTGDDE